MDDIKLPIGLLELNENELFYLLGEELATSEKSAVLALDGMEKSIKAAKVWLSEHREALRGCICGRPIIKAVLSEGNLNNQRAILLLSIADLVAGIAKGVSPFLVSALIIKQGIAELCK
jgi:hypothetical protein